MTDSVVNSRTINRSGLIPNAYHAKFATQRNGYARERPINPKKSCVAQGTTALARADSAKQTMQTAARTSGMDAMGPSLGMAFRLRRLEVQSELAHLISNQPGIGRADVARITGMARSTVSDHIQPLLDTGLFSEQKARYAGRGRPSLGLTLNARAGIILVADIGITHVRLVVTDLARQKLAEDALPPDYSVPPETMLERIASRFQELFQTQQLVDIPLRAMVVGIPSPVDFERGVPVRPPIMPGWDGFPVGEWLEKRMHVTVLVDNDVNLMALGEARSRPPSESPLIFIKVASGIGCGIITQGGALHRGADGDAGDIGHIRVAQASGLTCVCGNTGCIEAVASVPSIMRQIRVAKGDETIELPELGVLVSSGDITAIRLVREASAQIGEVVATLVNMFNPACIVLGGKLAHMSDDLLSGVRAAVYRRAPPLATRRLSIESARAGRDAGIIGGIALGVDSALSAHGLQKLQEATPGTAGGVGMAD
ncbi:ROK family transcriptional regulator [Verminephrobacter aporrectodeae subsp. tuberculatae]|nr:ROK family transcriptional regulator [Verminephrobacter aporrectodeae subsp. tuberculatae]